MVSAVQGIFLRKILLLNRKMLASRIILKQNLADLCRYSTDSGNSDFYGGALIVIFKEVRFI